MCISGTSIAVMDAESTASRPYTLRSCLSTNASEVWLVGVTVQSTASKAGAGAAKVIFHESCLGLLPLLILTRKKNGSPISRLHLASPEAILYHT